MLKVQYRMHPAIRTFPSAFFYGNELIDADSVLLREGPWYLGTTAAAGDAAAAAAAAAGDASIPSNPADPRKLRSPTSDAAAASALLGIDGNRGGNGGSSSSSSSLLLPYGVFDVSRGVEHSVGRSKANAAEAQLAVELYCQLRPALVVRRAAAAADAAAKQELLLALPKDVSGNAV
jgi:superfamily I DNA and/or RNA helicase